MVNTLNDTSVAILQDWTRDDVKLLLDGPTRRKVISSAAASNSLSACSRPASKQSSCAIRDNPTSCRGSAPPSTASTTPPG